MAGRRWVPASAVTSSSSRCEAPCKAGRNEASAYAGSGNLRARHTPVHANAGSMQPLTPQGRVENGNRGVRRVPGARRNGVAVTGVAVAEVAIAVVAVAGIASRDRHRDRHRQKVVRHTPSWCDRIHACARSRFCAPTWLSAQISVETRERSVGQRTEGRRAGRACATMMVLRGDPHAARDQWCRRATGSREQLGGIRCGSSQRIERPDNLPDDPA